jgi:hypothetical protein
MAARLGMHGNGERMMIKCRERTPLVEAYHHDLGHEIPEWLMTAILVKKAKLGPNSSIELHTRHGLVRAAVGDWIVQDAGGELRTWTPDAFARKYEPALVEN